MSGQDTLLLQNAAATGSAVDWPGGPGLMQVVGTFSGASVALQQLGPDGATYIAAGPVAMVAGTYPFNLPRGPIKGVVTGGPPSGIYARVTTTAGGLAASATGAAGQTVVATGPAASGAAVTGNPVLVAGQDGANVVTVLTDSAGRQIMVGGAAHDAAVAGAPVRIGAKAATSNPAGISAGDAVDALATQEGVIITRPWSIPAGTWSYAAANLGIVNTTTAVTIKAAGAAGIRNYVTGLDIMAEALGAATEVAIRDGAGGTVLWRTKIGTGGQPLTRITFPNPLRGTAATLLEFVTLTASVTGAVYVNADGYFAQ